MVFENVPVSGVLVVCGGEFAFARTLLIRSAVVSGLHPGTSVVPSTGSVIDAKFTFKLGGSS